MKMFITLYEIQGQRYEEKEDYEYKLMRFIKRISVFLFLVLTPPHV